MNKVVVSSIFVIAGCGGKVTIPSEPKAEAGPGAVAFGTPIPLSTSWEGWCEYSDLEQGLFNVHWGPGEGNKEHPCNKVDYSVSIKCDEGCTVKPIGEGSFHIYPDKPGVLHAHATLTPDQGRPHKRTKTIDLAPINVEIPTAAAVTCELDGAGAQVDVSLSTGATVLDHRAKVRVKDGAECTRNEYVGIQYGDQQRAFSCPVQGTIAELEVFSAGGHYTVAKSAACSLVFPSPDIGRPVAAGSSARYAFVINSSCEGDHVLRMTREAFEKWGWKEEPAPDQKTFVAARNGAKVEVDITDDQDVDQRRVCRWVLKTDAVAIRGTHELRH